MSGKQNKGTGVPKIAPPNRDLYGTDYPKYLRHWALFEGAVAERKKVWKAAIKVVTAPRKEPPSLTADELAFRGLEKAGRKAAKKRRAKERKRLHALEVATKEAMMVQRIVNANKNVANSAQKTRIVLQGEAEDDVKRVIEKRVVPGGWTVVERRKPGRKGPPKSEAAPRKDIYWIYSVAAKRLLGATLTSEREHQKAVRRSPQSAVAVAESLLIEAKDKLPTGMTWASLLAEIGTGRPSPAWSYLRSDAALLAAVDASKVKRSVQLGYIHLPGPAK